MVLLTSSHNILASGINVSINGDSSPEGLSSTLKILIFLTFLTFLPAIVLTMTSFTRIIIVFSLLRNALGTQTTPPNQVLIGLALFLTFFIMAPVVS
ncbi:MAG: flagellar biosynthetic protein FliP, partial [Turicibacter sp.]|nr:flagellar biosynthetic protein FliP [Turicibacter sp.]